MPTLETVLTANRHIGHEVNPTLLVGVDGSNVPTVPTFGATGLLLVDATGSSAPDPEVKYTIRKDYTVTPVTTLTWLEFTVSTAFAISRWNVFDSSGQTLQIAQGAIGAEVIMFYITPGGVEIEHRITAGVRLSVKAVSADATVGEIVIQGVA